MVATYDGLGVSFMYPDNWRLEESTEDAASAGVTVESPDGLFFAVNRYPGESDPDVVLDQAVEAMRREYPEVETDPVEDGAGWEADASVELSFYYLDLLITARMLALIDGDDILLVQMQGESRDFDRLSAVFLGMLQSLRNSLDAAE